MGHTNSTANLSLPQFIGTDKPTWLGDVNGAFLAIDGYAGTNDAAVAAAASDASSAISQASAAVNTANTANTTAGNASTTANNAIGVANTANAIAGTVDAKVGLLADLNTTDRTSIVNAINEVYGIASGSGSVSVTANGVKTRSQLLDELQALVDPAKITANSRIEINGLGEVLHISAAVSGVYNYGTFANYQILDMYELRSSGSVSGRYACNTSTYTDTSSQVVNTGTTIELFY